MLEDTIDFSPLPSGDPTSPASARPETNCTHCHGKGYMPGKEAKTFVKCQCVVIKEAHSYLTPVYASSFYYKSLNPNTLLQERNWRFDGIEQSKFKTVLKSFLLNTGMQYSHNTVTAADVVGATYDFENKAALQQLKEVDLLLLYLVADPKNGHYGKTLIALIEWRKLHNKRTWLFSANLIKSDAFANTYQPEFATYVETNFKKFQVT